VTLLVQIRQACLDFRQACFDFLGAVQFLTRLRMPPIPYPQDALARAVKYFPIVGLLIGSGSVLLYTLLVPHLPLAVVALLIVVYLAAITGCLHEDGLADAADGFGGGWEREKVLAIMRDSRIGAYGAVALALGLFARVLLITSLPRTQVDAFLIAAPVLGRWTTLPLSFYLPPARERTKEGTDGQGARIARLTTRGSLIMGTLFMCVILFALLRIRALIPILASVGVTLGTALYYKHRIGGITGDCFGTTNQLAEIAVYLCGVWV
jgi:adenosylcobinamide-GDP ribazoletransferase